jgi:hypothetical protein
MAFQMLDCCSVMLRVCKSLEEKEQSDPQVS